MTVIFILLAFIVVFAVATMLFAFYRIDELDEMEEELKKYSVHLDERANRIALEEKELRRMQKELYQKCDGQESVR